LSKLLRRDPMPDAIVLETSGVSDPAEIVRALLDPIIWQATALDAVICVADGRELADRPDLSHDALWQAQLRAADFVALTKTDLMDVEEQAQVRASLRRLKPDRAIYETLYGRIAPELLFSAQLYQPATTVVPRSAFTTPGFQTFSWTTSSALAADRFQVVINRFAARLIRAKGFVRFANAQERPMLFQLVGQRATIGPTPSNVPATAPTQIVFISTGSELMEAEIVDSLAGCIDTTGECPLNA
jgi:G3E family GTPase